jgi:hypothetical protein
MGWIAIRSWHVIRTWTRVPGRAITLCGRTATGESRDIFPSEERTCETCLRIAARRDDA